jgi:hypothetical protein
MTRTASPMPNHLQWVSGRAALRFVGNSIGRMRYAILCVNFSCAVPVSRAGLTRVSILVQRGVLGQPALARAHPCIKHGLG